MLRTDESSFSTIGFGHCTRAIRIPDEEHHPGCIDETFEQRHQRCHGANCAIPSNPSLGLFQVKRNAQQHIPKQIWNLVWYRCGIEAASNVVGLRWGRMEHQGKRSMQFGAEIRMVQWPARLPDLNSIEAPWMNAETELREI